MKKNLRAADLARELCKAPVAPTRSPIPKMRPFRSFPVDALPAPVARFVRSVAGATGTDPSWAALAALAVLGGCIGNRAAVVLKRGWVEPAIIWAALVGKSGSTKSVVLRLVTRPLVELFKAERDAFSENLRRYQADLEHYNAAMTNWKNAQKKGPATDPPVEPEAPREWRIIISDVTVEKVCAMLGENPLGLLLIRDELAGLINSFNRYAGGKGSDLQAWLSMNDGGPVLVDRKSDGSAFVERASVSILGTIQPFTLENVFGATEREAGLLARILLAYPPHRPALWTEEELPDDEVIAWRELLTALVALEPSHDDAGRPRPRQIGLAPEAKKAFIAWHDQHAHEIAQLADDHLRAHWSKLKGMCARIALLFACTEAVSGKSVSAVSIQCIEMAIRVTEWLKHESARIYEGIGGSCEERDARELADWIAGRGGAVTVRDLTHYRWEFRQKPDDARAALDHLVKIGLGRWVSSAPGPRGGPPAEIFELIRDNDISITTTPSGATEKGGCGDGEVF